MEGREGWGEGVVEGATDGEDERRSTPGEKGVGEAGGDERGDALGARGDREVEAVEAVEALEVRGVGEMGEEGVDKSGVDEDEGGEQGAEAGIDTGVEREGETESAREVLTESEAEVESGSGSGGKAAGEDGFCSEDDPGDKSSNLKVPSGRIAPNQTAQFRWRIRKGGRGSIPKEVPKKGAFTGESGAR